MVTLYKKSPNSLEEPQPKKPSDVQGPPTMSKGGLPHDRNQISRGVTRDISHPEKIG
jgi:hypothetical protein